MPLTKVEAHKGPPGTIWAKAILIFITKAPINDRDFQKALWLMNANPYFYQNCILTPILHSDRTSRYTIGVTRL